MKEIMIFGGFNELGETLKEGKVIMIENEDKGNLNML